MNKWTLAALALAAPTVAYADYGMAGCGLGSIVISKDGFVQVFAATTNGTFSSQSFGITFGTSNCVSDGAVMVDKEQEMFVEANLDALERDIAAGGGEYLAAFTTLLGCSEGIRPEAYAAAQAALPVAFPNDATNPQQALYVLKLQLASQHEIKAQCNRI